MSEHFPRQFGKYVLLKSLARGGMGEIYLAASGHGGGLNKLCVIKKVITEKTDRAKVNRFLDETKVVLRLSHANLVSTFDAGDVDGEMFIAMELVEGKDLREIWNRCVRTRTRIPVDVALVVVREIARALAYVHTYGSLRLVHRDVAPPNILLSYFGEVKLTDFGLARSVLKQEHTAPGVVFGRASYLAPEQARGEVADARTDVYSLGIVLWELLTGQPFLQLAGLDPVTSLSLVRSPKTQPPSSRAPWIAPDLDSVVLKALAADREVRFQSAEEMRRALSDVMTRVAPRADSERVAEFLRGLYRDLVIEEGTERDRLLAEILPRYRGNDVPETRTPRTDGGFRVAGPGPIVLDDPDADGNQVAALSSNDDATAVGAPPDDDVEIVPGGDGLKESLHTSALRARADSQGRRPEADSSGVDVPTKVWRKNRGARGEDAAQTFVGRVIDNRYRVRQRIGEGGMGTVYAAEHVEIGKSVAVKILHRIFLGEEELVERFRREARAASRVGHPHIIEVTDFGSTEEGCAYFVMELLEGLDLADVLVAEGRMEPARAIRIAIQICQALEAAHAAGIIHRDLKPENIFLVARDGQADFVKVLDFGIARNLSGESRRLTNPGMAMGTPEYMAPEQSQGKPADRRTDVYAAGALLHEMIMGVAPFQADSQQEMLEAKRRPLEPLRRLRPEIPAALDEIIVRALSPEADRRPQTMKQLEYELAKIAWGRPQAVSDLLGLKDGDVHEHPDESGSPQGGGPRAGASEHAGEAGDVPDVRHAGDPDDDLDRGWTNDAHPVAMSFDPEMPPTPPPVAAKVPLPTSVPTTAGVAAVSDLERLIEADFSPPPRIVTPARDAMHGREFNDDAAHPHVGHARSETGGTHRGTGAGMGTAAGTVSIDIDMNVPTLTPAHTIVPTLKPPHPEVLPSSVARQGRAGMGARGRAAILVLLATVGASAAWTASNGAPEFTRGWLARSGWGSPRHGVDQPKIGAGRAVFPISKASAGPTLRPKVVATVSDPAGTAMPLLIPAAAAPVSAPAPTAARAGPQIVQTPPLERARTALSAGAPDDAVAVLRPVAARGDAGAKAMLSEALVASGWNDVKVYRWNLAGRKAREALSLAEAGGSSHGAHALLGEVMYAVRDFNAALGEFNKALVETPRDARLKRRVIRSRRQMRRPESSDSVAGEPAAE